MLPEEIGLVVQTTRSELSNALSALFRSVHIVESLCKSREMDGQTHGHENVEDLMRLAPYIESPGTPLLRDAGLEIVVHVSFALLQRVSGDLR